MTEPDPTDPDAWQEAYIRRALAPYEALLPAEVLALMRDEIAWFLRTDPELSRFARRVRPRTAPEQSGTVGDEIAEVPIARIAQGAKKR